MSTLVLVAHGSRDPRAAPVTRALACAVGAVPAFLDHTSPSLRGALTAIASAGHTEAVVVPLLLTEAYHGRVDIPAVLAEVRAAGVSLVVRRAPVLAPATELVAALRRRLAELRRGYDALVLAAAGTRDAAARSTVDDAAAALGSAAGVPCVAAYASAAAPTSGEAVAALRAAGARRVVVASYFLAPGLLHDRAVASAFAAGAVGASAPLGAAPELATLVLARASSAHPVTRSYVRSRGGARDDHGVRASAERVPAA